MYVQNEHGQITGVDMERFHAIERVALAQIAG
jgi:hypothetical protein